MVNMTCPVEHSATDPVPFYHDGQLNFKAHDVGWIIAGFFTLIASTASFWLIWKHLTYFTCPQQQKHIVRMLIMVPIYAVVSFFSFFFYREAIYYQTIRDCYEAVVITSFFYLLLQYVGDTPAEQHEVFRKVKLQYWFFPLGCWKYRPSGLHFLWLMKISILQYAIVRPLCTLIAVGMEYYGIYCLDSWMPNFGHVWISVAISISVSVAMYCIIQFYLPIQEELKPYSPVLKFLAVKSVVFLTFWQDSFLSILVYFKVIKGTEYMTSDEVQVGINALLECFEMCIFAFLHIKAFTYLIYRPADHKRVTKRGAAMLHVLDFRDWFFEMKRSTKYVAAKSRGRDFTIVEDIRADKYRHLQKALGRDRKSEFEQRIENEKMENALDFWKDPNYVPPEEEEAEAEANAKDGDLDIDAERSAGRDEFKVERGYKVTNQSKLGSDSNRNSTPRTGTKSLDQDDHIDSLAYSNGMAQGDAHPELSQYHIYGTGVDDFEDPSIARGGFAEEVEQGYRSGSSNQGKHFYSRPVEQEDGGKTRSWWRSIKERISGSLGGGEVDAEDHFQQSAQHPDRGQDQRYAKPSKDTEEMEEKAGFLASPELEDEMDFGSRAKDASSLVDPIGRHHQHHVQDSPLSQLISTISPTSESQDEGKYTQLPARRSKAPPNASPLTTSSPQNASSRASQSSPHQYSQHSTASPLPPPQTLALQPQVTLVRDNSLAAVSSKQGSVSAIISSNQHGAVKVTPQSIDPAPVNSSPSISFAPSTNTFGRGPRTSASPASPPTNIAPGSTGAPSAITSSSQQRIMRSLSGMGAKGKAINLVLPAPLQPESYPFGTEGTAPEAASAHAPMREPSPPPNVSPVALNDKMERWISANASGSNSISSSKQHPVGPVHKKALEMKGKDTKKALESTKAKAAAKIVVGSQSLAQVRQEQEQERARQEAERKWESQEALSQKAVDWAAMQSRHGNSRIVNHPDPSQLIRGRERRTSAPSAPPSSVRDNARPQQTSKPKKKKDNKNEAPILALPAPSQFISRNDGDAFGAAAAAQVQTPESIPNASSRPRLSLDSSTRPSGFTGVGTGLQVGSVVAPMVYPSAPGMPQGRRYSSNQAHQPPPQWNGNTQMQQYPTSPGNEYWSKHYQDQQQSRPSRRHTDQPQIQSPQRYPQQQQQQQQQQSRPSNARPRQSYDGQTAEYRWGDNGRESAWAREEESRQREMASRANPHLQQQQQQRRSSAQRPTGFQFEYLD